MYILYAIVIVLFILCVIGFIKSALNTDHDPAPDFTEPQNNSNHKESVFFEKDHFTQMYLHRNDEKHQRHKRNQTPW